jgi:hypothetical protein
MGRATGLRCAGGPSKMLAAMAGRRGVKVLAAVALALAAGAPVLVASHASAQTASAGPSTSGSASPSAQGDELTIAADISGGLSVGDELVLRSDAAAHGGWQAMHRIEIELLSGDRTLETLGYDIEDSQISVGPYILVVGTGAEATSTYLRVSGSDVVVTTGGANLSLTITAGVVKDLPEDTRFRTTVVADLGGTATVTSSLSEGGGQGIGWDTVLTAVLVALVAGALIGNLFASRRRPPPRLSVYGSIQRRLDDERRSTSP